MPILGFDNITPIYEANARWCLWNINEIYSWTTNGVDGNRSTRVGSNKYVPKINDYVIDTINNLTYKVIDMDITDLTVTLKEVIASNSSTNLSNADLLLGVTTNSTSDTYRVYLDTSVIPFTLAVDARLKVGGSMTMYAKLFKGSDISQTGLVVSRLYDQSGNFVSENIPLEVVTYDTYTDPNGALVTINNNSVKVVSVCHTKYSLKDGELVTAVFYNDQAGVVSKRQLLVENTAFIRTLNASQKYITSIALETPFMSQTVGNLIECPLNLPVSSLGLIGVVNYSDGTKVKLSVDGNKFSLLGVNQYLSTIVGQKIDLVLSYNLSSTETVVGAITPNGKYVTKPYNLMTTPIDSVYNVKLFGYPKYLGDALGYTMAWYLYSLDRNVVFDVTNLVRFNVNTGAFRPNLFGSVQHLSVSINLKDVSGIYKSYIHTQTFDITLYDRPGNTDTSWTVGYVANQSPAYGVGLFASVKNIDVNAHDVNIGASFVFTDPLSASKKLAVFLEKVVSKTKPIYNVNTEISYPDPTHFTLNVAGVEQDYPIASWNTPVRFTGIINEYDTIIIKFYKQTLASKIHIAASGMEARIVV